MSAPEHNAVAPPPEAAGPEAPPGRAASVLGADMTLLGDNIIIVSQGKLELGARLTADVHAKEVLVRREACLHGQLWAERIDVEGEVRGSMIAVSLMLHDSARAAGDIMYQKLSVSEGAEVEARAHLIKDPSELMPILDAEALARGRDGKDADHTEDAMKAA